MGTALPAPADVMHVIEHALVLLINLLMVAVWIATPDLPLTLVLLPAGGGVFAVMVGLRDSYRRR
jgi:hypothetical protein